MSARTTCISTFSASSVLGPPCFRNSPLSRRLACSPSPCPASSSLKLTATRPNATLSTLTCPATKTSTSRYFIKQKSFIQIRANASSDDNETGTECSKEQDKTVAIVELPVASIRRPLARSRSNDPEKVKWLADSIAEIGLLEPIDVLEVDGKFYGFSGCHRYEAHQVLGKETIKCKVRKATANTLRMHLM
mmetsp:Transcript_12913/g.17658  ORF Transcript_12913/g.17658 Transcript_12913/m.17658 type:complete len:191 (+) Transcript_12913:69-641(+)